MIKIRLEEHTHQLEPDAEILLIPGRRRTSELGLLPRDPPEPTLVPHSVLYLRLKFPGGETGRVIRLET